MRVLEFRLDDGENYVGSISPHPLVTIDFGHGTKPLRITAKDKTIELITRIISQNIDQPGETFVNLISARLKKEFPLDYPEGQERELARKMYSRFRSAHWRQFATWDQLEEEWRRAWVAAAKVAIRELKVEP